jgi:hypothetical protein
VLGNSQNDTQKHNGDVVIFQEKGRLEILGIHGMLARLNSLQGDEGLESLESLDFFNSLDPSDS